MHAAREFSLRQSLLDAKPLNEADYILVGECHPRILDIAARYFNAGEMFEFTMKLHLFEIRTNTWSERRFR